MLKSVFSEILDYSDISKGKLVLDDICFDLRVCLEEVCDYAEQQTSAKGLTFNLMIHPEVPRFLRGDPGRLRQILKKLLDNAIKYTLEGNISVKIMTKTSSIDSASLRFTVSDTGIGLSLEEKQKLFSARSGTCCGGGLGLIIAKRIVHLMNGEIGVESSSGAGSTFWFTVKFNRQSETEVKKHAVLKRGTLKGVRIFLVDENEERRDNLLQQLTAWGAVCDEASNGKEALFVLEDLRDENKELFDIMIICEEGVRTNGMKLAGEIKKEEKFQDIRLILLTSEGMKGDAAKAREAGYVGYISTPIENEELKKCLESIVARKSKANIKPDLVTRYSVKEEEKLQERIHLYLHDPIVAKSLQKVLLKMGFTVTVSSPKKEEPIVHTDQCVLIMVDESFTASENASNTIAETVDIAWLIVSDSLTPENLEKWQKMNFKGAVSLPVNPKEAGTIIETVLNMSKEKRSFFIKPDPSALHVDFDRSVLLEGVGNEPDVINEIVDVYIEDVPSQIQAIKECIKQKDTDLLKRLAHTLKGASANIGANTLLSLSLQMEAASELEDWAKSAELILEIRDAFGSFVEAFNKAK